MGRVAELGSLGDFHAMQDLEPPSTGEETDWRKHMHSLPNGGSPRPIWVRWLFLGPFLLVAGSLVVLFGLSFAVGKDAPFAETGIVCGLLANLGLGRFVIWVCQRRGYSRRSWRAAFIVFTMPTWAFIVGLLCQGRELFSR